MSASDLTITQDGLCRYCNHPADPAEALCGFHLDWECACNIVEDKCGGSTPGSMVLAQMIEWGYDPNFIEARRAEEKV